MNGGGIRSDTGPFTIIPEWLLDEDVSDRAIRLYGILGRYADKGGKSHPGRRKLAERLRCSLDSVDRAVKELESVGAVSVEERFKEGTRERKSNHYILNRVRPGGRNPAATGGRTGAAENESQLLEEDSAVADATAATPTHTLVAEFVDRVRAEGADPPRRVVGQLAREVKKLCDEGAGEEELRAALNRLAERSLHPSTLPSVLFEIRQRGGPAENGRAVLDAFLAKHDGQWPTGTRMVRGAGGVSFVQDALGYDKPTHAVPWSKPTRDEIVRALR